MLMLLRFTMLLIAGKKINNDCRTISTYLLDINEKNLRKK